ncbi:MAG: cytochrome B [Lewinellaceae bacterium]|nr:cytochrome B [Lewinellaceae bacterium]
MEFYTILRHLHSGWRWVVLILVIVAIIQAGVQIRRKANYVLTRHRKFPLWTMIAAHIQLLVGLILYFVSSKVHFGTDTMSNPLARFFTVEHAISMVLAIILISVGFSRAKKQLDTPGGWNRIFWYYLLAILLILLQTPYPFQEYGAHWF